MCSVGLYSVIFHSLLASFVVTVVYT